MRLGLGLGELDHIAQRIGVQGRRRHQDERRLGGSADHRQVLARIVHPLGPLADVDAERAGAGEAEGQSVGRGLGDRVDAQHAAGAGAVLHHHRLAQNFLQRRLHGARHRVGAAAGREWNEKAERPVGKGLRAG